MNQNTLVMLGIAAVGGYLLYNWYTSSTAPAATTSTASAGSGTSPVLPPQAPVTNAPAPVPMTGPYGGPPLTPLATSCPPGQFLNSNSICQPVSIGPAPAIPTFQCPKNAICATPTFLNGLSGNRIPAAFIHRGMYGQF
jgi:hypothetical protein